MGPRDELKEKLEMMLDFMKEKGLISEQACTAIKQESAPDKQDSPLDQMVNELDQAGVEHRDIYNVNLQNKLMGMFAAKAIGMEQVAGAFLENVKNPDLRMEEEPKLDKMRLQAATISTTLTALHKENKNHLDSPTPDFDLIASQMINQYKNEMRPAIEKRFPSEKDKKLEELNELTMKMKGTLTKTLQNLFGGEDPRISGAIPFPILGPVFGNLSDMTNQTTPNENSVAFMVQSNTYNPAMPDDLGLETTLKAADISIGGSIIDAATTMTEVSKDMLNEAPLSIRQAHEITHPEPKT